MKKKKNKEEPKVFAKDIEGHIGDKDVEFLVDYVIGDKKGANGSSKVKNSSTSSLVYSNSVKENGIRGKKDRNGSISSSSGLVGGQCQGQRTEPRKRNNTERSLSPGADSVDRVISLTNNNPADASAILAQSSAGYYPTRATSQSWVLTEQSEHETSLPASPGHTPSVSSFVFASRSDEFSDTEKGYHSDHESGFQIPKRHRLRHKRPPRSLPPKQRSFHSSSYQSTTSSPLSTTPSTISFCSTAEAVSVNGATSTARGYESEREFGAEEYGTRPKRQRPDERRKVASSMPHSEQNSADNSDVDSSLSLPAVRRVTTEILPSCPTPMAKISYAQMAKSSVPIVTQSLPEKTFTVKARAASASNCDLQPSSARDSCHEPVTPVDDFPELSPDSEAKRNSSVAVEISSKPVLENEKKRSLSGLVATTATASTTPLTPSTISSNSSILLNNSLSSDKSTISSLSMNAVEGTRHASPSTASSRMAASVVNADSTHPVRPMMKSNSVAENLVAAKMPVTTASKAKPPLTSYSFDSVPQSSYLPAVIMLDGIADGKDDTTVGSSFTFGFFDDDAGGVQQVNNSCPALASVGACSQLSQEKAEAVSLYY